MSISEKQQALLRKLPGVDIILAKIQDDNDFFQIPKSVLVNSIRSVIEGLRTAIVGGQEISEKNLSEFLEINSIVEKLKIWVNQVMTLNLRPVINATGVVVHTNLGRSLLSTDAVDHILSVSGRYSNLEFDLSTGKRGIRYSCVEDILCEISGAEAAMVVNNNAAAVLLCLDTIAKDHEVIVSRGELVEIGGSFRIPDVMAKSGAILKEVGTTNRTHLKDYENAIATSTGLLLKVHTSNYSVVGFTASVSLKDIVELGMRYQIPVMEDLGSGTFIDFSRYGLSKEPTVQESIAAGTDVVTFSGDKLLGGPQGGIIVGKKNILDKIKKNPLTRALRIDKLTLASLESTLRLYRDEEKAIQSIPTLRMLTTSFATIEKKAFILEKELKTLNDSRLRIYLKNLSSCVGGGALPLLGLPSKCVGIKVEEVTANHIETFMRMHTPAIIGRIEDDLFIMDLRTVEEDELSAVTGAVADMLESVTNNGPG